MSAIPRNRDAFGQALMDRLEGRPGPELVLERDDGWRQPAMAPEEFFKPYEDWPEWERQAIDRAHGRVLDLGAGAGRHALHLQQVGHEVVAVDNSPGAVDVCRARGVRDARLADLIEVRLLEDDWDTVLLMCGNLGLAGDWESLRGWLARLASRAKPGALMIGDSVDPTDPDDEEYQERNRDRGLHIGHTRLRLHYGDTTSPWWNQVNIAASEVRSLVQGTGWSVEFQYEDGDDHVVIMTAT